MAEGIKRPVVLAILCLVYVGGAGTATAVDHVVLRRDGEESRVDGRLLVKAQDGGLLLVAPDGVLWTVKPEELVEHTSDDGDFEALSRRELSERLLGELPEGFQVYDTANYLICYNTSLAYAKWCGALFERLHRAFTNFWRTKGFDLSKPEFPLVAMVFADKQSYTKHAKGELGDAVESIIGYFSLQTNRMTMYDLTGIEALRQYTGSRATTAEINQMLGRPEAVRMVATVIHEATHQIAFNCGLHNRYSDCPLWFSEGIAIYFETPDLENTRGWRGIGEVNPPRLARIRDYLGRRPADSLKTLISDDQRFRDMEHGLDAYAEAWALTHFLLKRYSKQYIAYLKVLSEKKPLVYDDPQRRLEEFCEAFGDLEELDAEFVRYVVSLR